MRPAIVATLAAVLLIVAVFVWLFGSGAVFGQEAPAWPTAKAIVQTRVLGEDLVRLESDDEKYVATRDGRDEFLRLMRRRGYTLADQAGGGLFFRKRDGSGCAGTVLQFTSNLNVYYPPSC